jgi:hypothetical protein
MTIEEIAQEVFDYWMKKIESHNKGEQTPIPSQKTIEEFSEDFLNMLLKKQPRSLFAYSFVGLRGFDELSNRLPWNPQESTLIDWTTGKITPR